MTFNLIHPVLDLLRLFLFFWSIVNAIVVIWMFIVFRKTKYANTAALFSAISLALALLLVALAERSRIEKEFDWITSPISLLLLVAITIANTRNIYVWGYIVEHKSHRGPIEDRDVDDFYRKTR